MLIMLIEYLYICLRLKALKEELTYSSHLGVPAILVPLKSGKCTNLARILSEHALHNHTHQVSAVCDGISEW